ncbi:MAG TPA: hypothetical protein VLI93_01900 [Acetobacteraceae bacterium]|nr:hypothetical protein [Acetobacteraceae bacterium]
MRRALGLDGDQPRLQPQPQTSVGADRMLPNRPKRRFVADGEVPVVHGRLSRRDDLTPQTAPTTNRLEAAELATRTERDARDKAERLLHESQAAIHDLQTRLGHAQLALVEAQQALENERASAAVLRDALDEAEARLAAGTAAKDAAVQELRAAQAAAVQSRPTRQASEHPVQTPMPRAARFTKPKTAVRSQAATAKKLKIVAATTKPASARPEPKPVRWWVKSTSASKRR